MEAGCQQKHPSPAAGQNASENCEQGEMRPLPAAMDSPGARGRVPVLPVQEGQQPDVNLDKPQNDNGEQKELCHHRQTCRWGLERSMWAPGCLAVSRGCMPSGGQRGRHALFPSLVRERRHCHFHSSAFKFYLNEREPRNPLGSSCESCKRKQS